MTRSFLEVLAVRAFLLGAVGLVAIGVSGLVAAAMGTVFGREFVAGDPPGVTYTAERCQEFLDLYPDEPDCNAAALSDHYDEVVFFRGPSGALGLVALGAYALARRRLRIGAAPGVVDVVQSTAGAVAFGLLAALLLGSALERWAFHGPHGVGSELSGGIVAAAAFALYTWSFLRSLGRLVPATA